MTIQVGTDTANTRRELSVGAAKIAYYSIEAAEAAGLGDFSRLPAALRVVLENMLRFEDGKTVSRIICFVEYVPFNNDPEVDDFLDTSTNRFVV